METQEHNPEHSDENVTFMSELTFLIGKLGLLIIGGVIAVIITVTIIAVLVRLAVPITVLFFLYLIVRMMSGSKKT